MRTHQKLTTGVLHPQTNEAKKQIQKFAKIRKASSRRTWRSKQDLTDKNIFVFLLVPLLVKLLSRWDISTSCTYHVQSHLRHQVPLSIKEKKVSFAHNCQKVNVYILVKPSQSRFCSPRTWSLTFIFSKICHAICDQFKQLRKTDF